MNSLADGSFPQDRPLRDLRAQTTWTLTQRGAILSPSVQKQEASVRPGQIKMLTLEALQRLHVNCLDVLMGSDVRQRQDAEKLLRQIQDEFGDRSREPSGFIPMLRTMGYHVQSNGLKETHRRLLLRRIVHSELPLLNDREYMAAWGAPGTVERCRTLRREIRQYIIRYGNPSYMANAVERWQDDVLFVESLGREIADQARHSDPWPFGAAEARPELPHT